MSFLTPLGLLGALIAIPILLLYMLRLRRRELLVSSNFLWQQIVRDREANTPWQRLRRNLLLILQLIILALLVLALARPAQIVPTISAGKTVILLDASASMNATDVDGGMTRFDSAREQANLVLNNISAGDQVSIIRVAEIAEPIIAYTNDINALRARLNAVQAGTGRGDWETALTLAVAGAEGAESFTIIIISDGGLGDTIQLPENIPQPIYIPVGQSADNIAISALATRALPGQAPQLFAQVQNYDAVDVPVSLLIRLDGEIWQSITQTVSAESQRSFVFTIDREYSTVQAELVLDDTVVDYLTADNTAYTVAGSSSTRRVLLLSETSNVFLEQILRTLPGVQVFRGDTNRTSLPETPYDLYIFNGWLPTNLPDADMLIINPPASTSIFSVGEIIEPAGSLRITRRGHPLSAFLTVENVNLLRFRTVHSASWADVILETENGAVLLAGENRGRQIVVMPFNLLESDLPLQVSFPVLMSNAIEWFAPASILSSGTVITAGDTVRINPPLDATQIRVTLPDGQTRDLAVTGQGLGFTETFNTGFYQVDVLDNNTVRDTQVFAVNLFGADESDIAPVPAENIRLGGGVTEANENDQLGFREFWNILAFLAVVILLLEWFIYHRRQRIPTDLHTDLTRTTARS